MTEQLRVGTSSWSHESWRGTLYPEKGKPGDFLSHYAKRFDTVEIDSTWYRIPSETFIRKWERDTPTGFMFSAKVPSIITHEKRLVGCDAELTEFLRVMDLLGPKRGPLVFQFPFDFKPDQFDTLKKFLETLPSGFKFALEVRHKGWLTERFYDLLRGRAIALVLLDLPWMPKLDLRTTDWTYIRFIGDRKKIEAQTTTWEKIVVDRAKEMEEWAPRVQKFLDDGVITWAYFNNHYAGHAPGSVELFLKHLEDRRRGPVRALPLELLRFDTMASGQRALALTGKMSWDGFPEFAEALVALLGGKITLRSDSGDERVWTFERKGSRYWVSFEDLSGEASIEPRDEAAGAAMEDIHAVLAAAPK